MTKESNVPTRKDYKHCKAGLLYGIPDHPATPSNRNICRIRSVASFATDRSLEDLKHPEDEI